MHYFPQIKNKLLHLLPVLLLYFFSFYNFEELKNIGKINFFSFNFQMILIYFYILKYPEYLGFGHIFLCGLITDTVIGTPLGTTSLSYLSLSLFTTYLRNSTLRSIMTAEWFTFIPALFFSNFIYLIIVNNFSNVSFYYVELLQNTFFTFLFFPFFYYFFNYYQKFFIKD
jgi:cell shape-determining protein MreD